VFNFGDSGVRNFLVANASCSSNFHISGLRVDARGRLDALPRLLARSCGWLPNVNGGRENLEAISFLRR
jgi:1,4-alpha-glucan branching enzyme